MTSRKCPNCSSDAGGQFCASCGQRQGELIPSFREWLAEAVDEVLLVEARLPKSLVALFWPPGKLTAEWWCGRRAQYVSPLRLYLVMAIPFFLVFNAGPRGTSTSFLEIFAFAPMEMAEYDAFVSPQGPLPSELAGDSAARAAWQAEYLRIQRHNDSILALRSDLYEAGSGRVFDVVPILIGLGMVPLMALGLWSSVGHGFLGALVLSLNLHSVAYAASVAGWLVGWGLWPGALAGTLSLAAIRKSLLGEGWLLAIVGAMAVAVVYGLSFMVAFLVVAFGLNVV